MPPTICPNIQQVNSTSYADVVGLALGLSRLPNESTVAYTDRLYQATTLTRDHSFQGTVNEIALQLGLKVVPGITVSSTDINATISSNISGVTLVSGNTTINIPLVTIDPDDVWSWRLLSNITADINTHSPLFTATLLTSDGPALQLVQQGNVSNVVAEQVTGGRMILDNPGVIVGTELFNNPVPTYTITSGVLAFTSAPPVGTTITYSYRVLPYDLVCSQVGVFGLLSPGVSTVAITPDSAMVYQLREAVQEVMLNDRSYWAV
jgi:hypothetical protein